MRITASILTIVLSFSAPVAAWAADPVQQHNSNAVWFENWTGLSNANMTVVQPNGTMIRVFAEAGTPVFQLDPEEVLDGIYRYELTAATEEEVEIVNAVDNGRGETARDTIFKPFYTSGHFTVSRGVIIPPETIQEETD